MELVPAKGWRIPASPPHVSSYLFLLPVYDAPSSAERKERIGEEERREGGREGDGLSIFIMFAPKKERREGGKREKRKRNETVGIHVWRERESARDARHARIYSRENARAKRTGAKKGDRKNAPRRTNVVGRLN